jgi:hypothetical protein
MIRYGDRIHNASCSLQLSNLVLITDMIYSRTRSMQLVTWSTKIPNYRYVNEVIGYRYYTYLSLLGYSLSNRLLLFIYESVEGVV